MQGLDTETQLGRAVLVCTPRAELRLPRTVSAVLEWLSDVGDDFIAFNAGYDVQAVLALRKPRRSLGRLGLTGRDVIEGWSLHYIPDKLLEATRDGKRVRVFDAYQFFGRSLDSAAKKHLGEAKHETSPRLTAYIHRGRAGDALRDSRTRDELVTYCRKDADQAERLWQAVADSYTALGVDPERPVSPASVARRYWAKQTAEPRTIGSDPFDLRADCERAYRGGRIETIRRGMFRDCYRYDIRSAYPAAMSVLPHVDDCDRVYSRNIRPDAAYAIADLELYSGPLWDIPGAILPVAVIHRDVLTYPSGHFPRVTVDLHTWKLATECGIVRRVIRGIQFVPRPAARYPFADFPRFFAERKTRPEASFAIKLLLNSSYGLLAERVTQVGAATEPEGLMFTEWGMMNRHELRGPAQCFLAAAHITGRVRAQLYRAALDCDPVTMMTDGLISLRPINLPLGDGLGDWSDEGRCDAIVVGGGVYSTAPPGTDVADGKAWRGKHRGWRGLDLIDALTSNPNASRVPLATLRAASLRECATSRERWSLLNRLDNVPRLLDLNFDVKRNWPRRMRARDFLASSQVSCPLRLYGE